MAWDQCDGKRNTAVSAAGFDSVSHREGRGFPDRKKYIESIVPHLSVYVSKLSSHINKGYSTQANIQ